MSFLGWTTCEHKRHKITSYTYTYETELPTGPDIWILLILVPILRNIR